MTSAQSLQRHLQGHVVRVGRLFLVFQRRGQVLAAGAADVEFPLILRVEVEQDIPLNSAGLQAEGTEHAGLLIGGYQSH